MVVAGDVSYSPDGNTWTEAPTVSGVADKGGITTIGFGVAFNNEII